MTVGTHQLHLRTQGSVSLLRAKKRSPLTAGTQQLYLRTQGSASLSSQTARTHPVEAYVALSVLSERVRTYWSIGRSATMNRGRVSSSTCHSIAPHVAVQVVPSKTCTQFRRDNLNCNMGCSTMICAATYSTTVHRCRATDRPVCTYTFRQDRQRYICFDRVGPNYQGG